MFPKGHVMDPKQACHSLRGQENYISCFCIADRVWQHHLRQDRFILTQSERAVWLRGLALNLSRGGCGSQAVEQETSGIEKSYTRKVLALMLAQLCRERHASLTHTPSGYPRAGLPREHQTRSQDSKANTAAGRRHQTSVCDPSAGL